MTDRIQAIREAREALVKALSELPMDVYLTHRDAWTLIDKTLSQASEVEAQAIERCAQAMALQWGDYTDLVTQMEAA